MDDRVQKALSVQVTTGPNWQIDNQEMVTLREYLCRVLDMLWDHPPDFDPERPFGEKEDWQHNIYEALFSSGLVRGGVAEGETLIVPDYDDADGLVADAIEWLAKGSQ